MRLCKKRVHKEKHIYQLAYLYISFITKATFHILNTFSSNNVLSDISICDLMPKIYFMQENRISF